MARFSLCGLSVLAGLLAPDGAGAAPRSPAGSPQAIGEVDALGRVVRTSEGVRRSYADGPRGEEALVPKGPEPVSDPATTQEAPGVSGAWAAGSLGGDLPIHLEWYRALFGYSLGFRGLEIADLDADGVNEVVLANGFQSWEIYERKGGGFDQAWASLPYPTELSALRVLRLGSESIVVLGFVNGDLVLVDGISRTAFRTISTGATETRGLSFGDVDGDGSPEAVFCDPDEVFVVDLQTGDIVKTTRPCLDVAVGQVDDEASLEIVVATPADPAYVLDAETLAVEWTNNLGFGNQVEVGDLDGDGMEEVAAGNYSELTVFNADTRSIAYTVYAGDLATHRIANADGDPQLELLYGDGQWGDVHALNGATGAEEWSIWNPEHGVTGIAVGQLDGDAALEVVWGAGHTSSGPDRIFVGDTVSQVFEWQSIDFNSAIYAVGGDDLDGSGPDIFYGSYQSDSGYGGGLYEIRDGRTKELEHTGLFDEVSWGSLWRMAAADATGGEAKELFFAGSRIYTGVLVCRDLSGAEIWRVLGEDGVGFRGLAVADVDGDGELEVVATTGMEHSGATAISLHIYDAETGAPEWQSPSMGLGNDFSLLRLADVDGDPALEAVVGGLGGRVWIWDLQARLDQQATLDLNVTALDTFDVDGDGTHEIFIGTSEGLVRSIDVSSGDATTVVGPVGEQIEALALRDLTGDLIPDYVLATLTRIEVRDGLDESIRWSQGTPGQIFFFGTDALRVGDFDGDGETEILGSVALGVGLFGDDARDATLFRDGFETGSPFKWTSSQPSP